MLQPEGAPEPLRSLSQHQTGAVQEPTQPGYQAPPALHQQQPAYLPPPRPLAPTPPLPPQHGYEQVIRTQQHHLGLGDVCSATLLRAYTNHLPMQVPICIVSTMLLARLADSTCYEALWLMSNSTAGALHLPLTNDVMPHLRDGNQRARGCPPSADGAGAGTVRPAAAGAARRCCAAPGPVARPAAGPLHPAAALQPRR